MAEDSIRCSHGTGFTGETRPCGAAPRPRPEPHPETAAPDRHEFLALFVTCLFAFTRHNSFPYYCHHDEPGKAEQLLSREFNFHHPLLLLLTTDLVRRARGVSDDYQQVAMSGRWVSATFAALSVVLQL